MIRLICLAAIGLVGLSQAASADPSALVQIAIAKESVLRPRIEAYGTVVPDPAYLTTIAVPRDSVIRAVWVRAGQLLHAGDAIVTIQTAPGAFSSFQQAKSALAFAQRDLVHTQDLYTQQLATRSQLANAQKAAADAQAQLQAETKIGAGKSSEILRASAPGIVTALNASPGDRVQANTVIASIAMRNRLLVNLGLEPKDALDVSHGAKVVLHSPQRKETNFIGQIQSVDAMMDPKSRLVNAVVTIPKTIADQLVLGMALDGVVESPGTRGVVVPHGALLIDGAGTYVFVVKENVAHRRNVVVALETDKDALISRGVTAGSLVVVAGNAGLEDGTHVRVR